MFSNYSVKKILPRLVIVAIAVNVSFYICAAAVDISNILGSNLRDFVSNIATGIPNGPDPHALAEVFGNLASNTGILMVGVTIGVLLLIFSQLGTVIIGILMVLAVLAMREVLVTVLIIISPIAFVLYLLPNTEKLFKRWLNEFLRVLVVYPAIALVWGATELVTTIIMATGPDGVPQFVMACLVQLAPVVSIIPIMKMGGQALGKLEGMARKGLDKTPIKDWGNLGGKLIKGIPMQNLANRIRDPKGLNKEVEERQKSIAERKKAIQKAKKGIKEGKEGAADKLRELKEAQSGDKAALKEDAAALEEVRANRARKVTGGFISYLGSAGSGNFKEQLQQIADAEKKSSDAGQKTEKMKVDLELNDRAVRAALATKEYELKARIEPEAVDFEARLRALKERTEGPTLDSREMKVLDRQLELANALPEDDPGKPAAVNAASAARDAFQLKITDAQKSGLENAARSVDVSPIGLAEQLVKGVKQEDGTFKRGISKKTLESLMANGLSISTTDAFKEMGGDEMVTLENVGSMLADDSQGLIWRLGNDYTNARTDGGVDDLDFVKEMRYARDLARAAPASRETTLMQAGAVNQLYQASSLDHSYKRKQTRMDEIEHGKREPKSSGEEPKP